MLTLHTSSQCSTRAAMSAKATALSQPKQRGKTRGTSASGNRKLVGKHRKFTVKIQVRVRLSRALFAVHCKVCSCDFQMLTSAHRAGPNRPTEEHRARRGALLLRQTKAVETLHPTRHQDIRQDLGGMCAVFSAGFRSAVAVTDLSAAPLSGVGRPSKTAESTTNCSTRPM